MTDHRPGIVAGLALLRRPDFARLFVAYLISYTGTAMAPIAMAFGVLELTGSTRDSAIVIAAPVVAQIAVILVGGALADRTSRQRLLVGADFLAMASQGVIAYLFLSGQATVPALTALMLVNGIAAGFNTPSATGFIPQMVSPADLQSANALLGVARNSAVTLGAALAGVLVATFGAGVTLAIDAISFGVSGLLIASLRPRRQIPPEQASLVEDLRRGWREFTSHTWLWTIVLQFSLIVAAMEAVFGLIGPAVARDLFGGAKDWGYIAAAFGGGTLLGGLIAMRIAPRRPMLFASICVFFFCLVPLALSVPLPVAVICVAAFIEGVLGQIFAVLWYTTLQRMVAPSMLSRVSAYDHLGSVVLAPLGVVVGGILYEEIGFRMTLLVAAATVIIPTACVLMVRDVRQLSADDVRRRQQQLQQAADQASSETQLP